MKLTSNVDTVVEEIRPIIQQAIFFSRIANKEYFVKLIYERSSNRVQIKENYSGFRIIGLNGSKRIRATSLPITEAGSKVRTESVITSISPDIVMLFKPAYLMEELGNVELCFKFRDASMVSFTRTEYRQKHESRSEGYNQSYLD